MSVDTRQLIREFGEPLVAFLIDSFTDGDGSEQDMAVVEDMLRNDFVGYFENARDAGYALVQRNLPVLRAALGPNICKYIDFATYYEDRCSHGYVHQVDTDDAAGFWVFLAR